MRRALPIVAAVAAVFPATAVGGSSYDRTGDYLDYADRPSLLDGFSGDYADYEIQPGGQGIVELSPTGAAYPSSAINDAAYGLWHFTRYVDRGRRADLAEAERAARWINRKQDPRTGAYPIFVEYSFGTRPDGTDEVVLEPPWYGANLQAIPISLLTRLYRTTGERKYLERARLSLRLLAKPNSEGGVQAPFLDTGETFFEGYATLPFEVHTLSHHVQTMLALHDMRDLSKTADRLFQKGMRTLHVGLPFYDLPESGRSAAWLIHVTDPPRSVSTLSGFYQEFMVAYLRALDSVAPDPVITRYADIWEAHLSAICAEPAENCYYH